MTDIAELHAQALDATGRTVCGVPAGDKRTVSEQNGQFRRGPGAAELSGSYDLITFFDCLHDMPDPAGALRAARAATAEGGSVMLVEPMSWDSVQECRNPLGKLLAAASTFICLPSGLSAAPAHGLGNQASPARTCELARDAGFSEARIAASTDFNLVYELRT